MNRFKALALVTLGLLLLLTQTGCGDGSTKSSEEPIIPIVNNYEELAQLLVPQADSIYVLNFWATWCAPCVKEIPYLERIAKDYSDQKVRVTLVNLDFPKHFESRVVPFVVERIVHSRVIMLTDPDANSWIPRVHPDWTGSIPATLVYTKNAQLFFEREITYQQLADAIAKLQ